MQQDSARILGVLLCLSLGSGLAWTTEQESVVPGTTAEIVRLDAVVSDAKGELVKGLKKEDFVVLEDGKAQRLSEFLAIDAQRRAAPGAPTAAPEATAAQVGTTQDAGPGRQIVLAVDDIHIASGNIAFARQAMKAFVENYLVADDNVGLVTTSGVGGVAELTRDRGVLLAAVSSVNTHDSNPPLVHPMDLSPELAEQILRGDVSALQFAATESANDTSSVYNVHGGGLQGMSTQSHLAGAQQVVDPALAAAEQDAERRARGILGQALHFSVTTLSKVEAVIRSMAHLPGRKICLLVSDGFLVGAGTDTERLRNIQSLTDAATRSGAVVYALDSKGLATTIEDASSMGSAAPGLAPGLQHGVNRQAEQQLQTTLERISRDTGGFLVHGTNDLEGGLRRMLQDNDDYYLMGYAPVNTKRDGKFRKIEVRVASHPDYLVRTRAGYLAPGGKEPAPEPPIGPPVLDPSSLQKILATSPTAATPLAFQGSADYVEPNEGPRVIVQAHLEAKGLRWETGGGLHKASLDFAGGIYDESGALVGVPFGSHSDLALKDADFNKAKDEGLQYEEQVPLAPGRYQVRLVAKDGKGAAVSSWSQAIEVPDLKNKKLALSGLFISASNGAAGAAPSKENFRGIQATRRIKSSDALNFQLYVYNPATDDSGASDVVLQAQISQNGKLLAASKAEKVGLRRQNGVLAPETAEMPLSGLAPGTYSLKVVVVDRKAQATVARSVDFVVE